jgi:hypothetical protein
MTALESGTRVTAGADLRFRLSHTTSSRPFLFVGVGFAAQAGAEMAFTMAGDYQFVRLGVPFHEEDTVTVRYRSASVPFLRFGGGVTKDLGRKYGVRGDLGLILEPNRLRVVIDTTPTAVAGNPAGTGVVFGGPNTIRFSTVPGTPTSLSTELFEFETFKGAGLRVNLVASAGLFIRF